MSIVQNGYDPLEIYYQPKGIAVYQDDTDSVDVPFITMTLSYKMFFINCAALQGLFIILSLITSFVASSSMAHLTGDLFRSIDATGLSRFSLHMISVTFIVAIFFAVFLKYKKIDRVPLCFLSGFPGLMLLFSATRFVSSVWVFVLSTLAVIIVLFFNYHRIKQQALESCMSFNQ
ncbi:hypothetical protein PULV_b0394 [Pseudoalteromonas ulvae UL12]|uniref:hypothetical protein n=1 Tax=Pseudoalteromonas ulvae TaxID=107327 RepID=UPI00186B6E9B|nr:hypothetical protein [Pseudoalteromonas ulvae]MBE0365745.1 hypothetical protein [Pseudoalteromonas ulvae UL12]